jgi:signal transduction histidine kinase/ActR/RegA family two-component response regulator
MWSDGAVAVHESRNAVSEWSFNRRLVTGVLVLSLLAVLTTAVSLISTRSILVSLLPDTSAQQLYLDDARGLQLLGIEHGVNVNACLLPQGDKLVPVALASGTEFRRVARGMSAKTADPRARALLDEVLATQRALQDALERRLAGPAPGSRGMTAGDADSIHAREQVFRRALIDFVRRADADWQASAAAAQRTAARSGVMMLVMTGVAVVLLAVTCVLLIGNLMRSYRRQTTARTAAERGQSEARATLSDVEAASHLKDEFLATVSHELRNPLAPILTWTQLLRSGTLDEAKTRQALEVIERNVVSQAQLIDDLVDVSRVVSGKFRLDVRPVDLVPVIRAAAESQGPASEAKHIRLQLVLDERAGMISGDSERLQQVMWNLISNAIKFTPKGGRVQVVLQRAASHVEVVVSDSGIGIDFEFLPHVFEPFRQGTGGSMRRHGGLGLGLSIVRHIVELHGGEIIAFSDGPQRGATFTIKFPLLATAQDAQVPQALHPIAGAALGSGRLARLDGIRVLIVEDEPSTSEALSVLFKSCGAEPRVADSAVEALAVFDVWLPDVVVSDIAMPGQDGYSLVRSIRRRPREAGGGVPAVALTAYAKIDDRVSILAAGFNMYLSKPANPSELIAVVGSLARRASPTVPEAGT